MKIKHYTIKLILLIIVALLNVSCFKLIPYNEHEMEEKVVLNSLLYEGEIPKVTLFYTKSQFNSNIKYFDSITMNYLSHLPIINADLELFEDDISLGKMQNISGPYYQLPEYKVKSGKNYKVEVIDPNSGELVYSETTIPETVEIISIDTVEIYTSEQPGVEGTVSYIDSIMYELSFKNNINIKNYYKLEYLHQSQDVELEWNGDSYDTIAISDIHTRTLRISNNSANIISESFIAGGYRNRALVFTNLNLNEENAKIRFCITPPSTYMNLHLLKIELKLTCITQDMYLYLKSYNKAIDAWDSPFTEPVVVYNNIEGGFGIFSGNSVSSVVVLFDEPL